MSPALKLPNNRYYRNPASYYSNAIPASSPWVSSVLGKAYTYPLKLLISEIRALQSDGPHVTKGATPKVACVKIVDFKCHADETQYKGSTGQHGARASSIVVTVRAQQQY